MYHSYWLAKDNGDTFGDIGSKSYCGATCKMNKFYLTSDVAQTIYVSTNLNFERPYIEEPCTAAASSSLYNYTKLCGLSACKSYIWKTGSLDFAPFKIAAGETVTLYAEIDWNAPNMNKSFSVTAWGEQAKVNIRHSKGSQSAHYYVAGPQMQGSTALAAT